MLILIMITVNYLLQFNLYKYFLIHLILKMHMNKKKYFVICVIQLVRRAALMHRRIIFKLHWLL